MRSGLAIVVWGIAACAPAHRKPPATAAAVELVESVPVESTLDHADIPDAFEVWPAMIAGAKERLDIAQFYISNEPGSRLETVVQAIETAIKRGVKVRLLADEKFYKTYPETIERIGTAGATVRRFDVGKHFGAGVLHAKYFVVDGREGYLGSQNFDWRSLEHIQELGVRTTTPEVVQGLSDVFDLDWSIAGGEPAPAARVGRAAGPVVFAASPKDHLPAGVSWELPLMIERIAAAKRSVRIQVMTYKSGDFRELEDAMVAAAARGVKVQLLVANWILRPKTLEPLRKIDPRIEVKIITIPPAAKGHIPFGRVAHAKFMIVDGVHAWLSTSNIERDYFYQSRNVAIFYDEPRLESIFEGHWTSSYSQPFDRAGTYAAPKVGE